MSRPEKELDRHAVANATTDRLREEPDRLPPGYVFGDVGIEPRMDHIHDSDRRRAPLLIHQEVLRVEPTDPLVLPGDRPDDVERVVAVLGEESGPVARKAEIDVPLAMLRWDSCGEGDDLTRGNKVGDKSWAALGGEVLGHLEA